MGLPCTLGDERGGQGLRNGVLMHVRARLQAFGVFASTEHLIRAHLATKPTLDPSSSALRDAPARRPSLPLTSSAPTVPLSDKPTKRTRPYPPTRPLSASDISVYAGLPPPSPPRALAKSTASLPGFLRGIRTSSDGRKVVVHDLATTRSRPMTHSLTTDRAGPSYSQCLSSEPASLSPESSSSSYLSPFTPRPQFSSPSTPSSPSFEMDEPELRSRHVVSPSSGASFSSSAKRNAKRSSVARSMQSSNDSYSGDGDGEGSSTGGGRSRRISLGGAESPASQPRWVTALKRGFGGGKKEKGRSSSPGSGSDASSSWEMVGDDAPRRSFEVLHRRPVATRSQSANVVGSYRPTLGEDLVASTASTAMASTPCLSKIEERPEPQKCTRPSSILDFPPSTSNVPTPIPSPSPSVTTQSTPNARLLTSHPLSRTLEFAKVSPASHADPAPSSLLAASRPPSPSPPLPPSGGPPIFPLKARELFFFSRRRSTKGSSSDEDGLDRPHRETASSWATTTPPSLDSSIISSTLPSSRPGLSQRRPSDSDLSYSTTASETDEGHETPASSGAELEDDDRGDFSLDDTRARRLAGSAKPWSAGVGWQAKVRVVRDRSDQV